MKTLRILGLPLLVTGILALREMSAHDLRSQHLQQAQNLIEHLELRNTSYRHGPPDETFTSPYVAHADCSGFIQALLQSSYGYIEDQFKAKFGHARMTAENYHDLIMRNSTFEQINDLKRVVEGDFVAVKYDSPKDKSTGHVMLVATAPKEIVATQPIEPDTRQWEVVVIDSAKSGHGKADTRHGAGKAGKDHDGVGRGVIRVYADSHGSVVGYTWSVGGKTLVRQSEAHVAIGRLKQ